MRVKFYAEEIVSLLSSRLREKSECKSWVNYVHRVRP